MMKYISTYYRKKRKKTLNKSDGIVANASSTFNRFTVLICLYGAINITTHFAELAK